MNARSVVKVSVTPVKDRSKIPDWSDGRTGRRPVKGSGARADPGTGKMHVHTGADDR